MLTSAFAAPTVAQLGVAHVTVTVAPDPPVVGVTTVSGEVSGASASRLNATTVRYATLMPSMKMSGPSGVASRVAGRANIWRFHVELGMAAPWALRVQLSGGVTGTVTATLAVGQPARASSQTTAASGSAASMTLAGMSADDAAPWRNATFALVALIAIGALVLRRNRHPAVVGFVVVAGLVILGLAYAQARFVSPAMDMNAMQNVGGSAPVPVTLARVTGDRKHTLIEAPANVEPYLVQNIVARVPGVLTDFQAYTGDRLAAGQIVARLQEPELQSDAQAAQAAAQAARRTWSAAKSDADSMRADVSGQREQLRYWNAEIAREKRLLDEGAVSVQEYQDERAQAAAARSAYASVLAKANGADASIGAAQARVEQAAADAQSQNALAGYTNVVVPSDSVVMQRLVDPGVYVQPGTPILQVAVIDRLRVQAQVAQGDLSGIAIGTPIDVKFDDGKMLHGYISSVSPVVDSSTHTAIAEAIVPNANGSYQPGSYAHVVLHVQGHTNANAFNVPSGAVVGGANSAVWIDRAGGAHRVTVTVISDDGTTAQVSGNLRSSDRVVVTGANGLEEGQPIAEAGP